MPLGAKLLHVTPKAVDLMLAQLGGARPRELIGRTRYRAWASCKAIHDRRPLTRQPYGSNRRPVSCAGIMLRPANRHALTSWPQGPEPYQDNRRGTIEEDHVALTRRSRSARVDRDARSWTSRSR
ncbi:MAG: helix-turn-helix domain-containing protein [Microvirga sp.]